MRLEKKEVEESTEELTEEKVIDRVTVKEKVPRTVPLDLDDLMPKNMDKEKQYNNWYFVINYTHEGKEYLGKFAITQGNLVHQNTKINLAAGPLPLKKEDNIEVINKPTGDISIIEPQEDSAFKYGKKEDSVVLEMGELKAICKADEWKIFSSNETLGCELTFTPRGPPAYWGGELNKKCQIMEGSINLGIENLSNVRGKLIINGEEIEVEGRGLFERVVVESVNFLEIRMINWIYANFDQSLLWLFQADSANSKGCPFHYETGTVYLMGEDDYLLANKIEIMPEKWGYIKEVYRFAPYQQKIKVETDKGDLELTTNVSMYPVFIEEPRRIEWLTLHNLTGWDVLFYDSPITSEGKFTYKDGKTLKLTNGTGINEQIRIAPL